MTQNYSPYPVYYTVSFNLTSPTDYSSLTGSQSGGLDVGQAARYNQRISVTGNIVINSTTMSAGETIVINGYTIGFASTDTVADIVTKIQLASKFTNVTAHKEVATNCVTLTNTVDKMGYPFYVAEGNGTGLAKLGINPGTYSAGVTTYGGAFTNFKNGDVITINGVSINFTGATTAAAAVTAINAVQTQTNVLAQLYGAGKVQLGSLINQAYVLGGANIANLGYSSTAYTGFPLTLAQSQSKEQGNMRYIQAVSEIEKMATPFSLGSWQATGNQDGNAAPTTFQFTVGFNNVDQVQTIATDEEPDAGTVYNREDAIKRSVARALTHTLISNRKVFDPTTATYGQYADRPNSARITQLTAAGLDVIGNITTVEDNITVTQIASV